MKKIEGQYGHYSAVIKAHQERITDEFYLGGLDREDPIGDLAATDRKNRYFWRARYLQDLKQRQRRQSSKS